MLTDQERRARMGGGRSSGAEDTDVDRTVGGDGWRAGDDALLGLDPILVFGEQGRPGPSAESPASDGLERAARRSRAAHQRDLNAAARDRAAARRDRAALLWERELQARVRGADAAAVAAHAAADRARAAADRALASADRAAAARDREDARAELRRAQVDPLTGAYGRGLGLATIDREINRARHGRNRLVLAFVDIDDFKQVNDRHGHAAGDALLRDVVAAIREHVRSYDPVVRLGGDEFLCALLDMTAGQARRRFKRIRATIAQTHPGATISVGYATLQPRDTPAGLTNRGDQALYRAKKHREAQPGDAEPRASRT